jgi:hypothetical protein
MTVFQIIEMLDILLIGFLIHSRIERGTIHFYCTTLVQRLDVLINLHEHFAARALKKKKCFLIPIPLKPSELQFSPTGPMETPACPYFPSIDRKNNFSFLFPGCPLESTTKTSNRARLPPKLT